MIKRHHLLRRTQFAATQELQSRSDGRSCFILTVDVSLCRLYLRDAASCLLLFYFHKRVVCLDGGYIVQYVETSEVWRPKFLAYLAYAYCKYGTAGEVMCFLGVLRLLMLRKNKYLVQQQGVF